MAVFEKGYMNAQLKKVVEETNKLLDAGIFICAVGLVLCWVTGCAMRVSVTPIQAEEFTQKTVTNQLFDWLFNAKENKA